MLAENGRKAPEHTELCRDRETPTSRSSASQTAKRKPAAWLQTQDKEADLSAVRGAGYTDAQVIEIVQHVALNTWTNYFNEVFRTDIDFPVVAARKAA
jgi:alkylhydroperoxidase family enzyme